MSRLSAITISMLLLAQSTLLAQQVQLGSGTHYGYATVIVTVDAQGRMSFAIDTTKPVTIFPSVNPQPNPQPTPNPQPNPEPTIPFEKTISDITKIVISQGGSKTTAAGISSVYSLVSEGVEDGSISTDKAFSAVSSATSLILSSQSDGTKWGEWRDEVSKALVVLQQDGSLRTKEDYSKVFKQISNGVNHAIGINSEVLSQLIDGNKRVDLGLFENIDIQRLIELIKLIMELLKLFGLSK